ncbi:hypothetical protein EOM60_01225 [Candidatus Saccharibacteria bacterium]|nr:hypothetical protein [Candidatus Saccharibacteria bacterium]
MDTEQNSNDSSADEQIERTPEQLVHTGPLGAPVSWESPEGIKAERGVIWFIVFAIVTVSLIALAVWTGSISFAVLIAIAAASVIVLHKLPPKIINYSVSAKGVYVGDKLYDYSEFRSFGVQQQAGLFSATLMPAKRFALSLTIYFPEDKGEQIVDMLGSRLPMQEIKIDTLEKFVRLIKL